MNEDKELSLKKKIDFVYNTLNENKKVREKRLKIPRRDRKSVV